MNRESLLLVLAVLFAPACKRLESGTATPAEARSIAKEAYLYGFPMIENYKTIHAYCVDRNGSQYKAPMNQLKNEARVYTPKDTAVVTPNSDTPYSFVVMDLRAEPIVLTVPRMEQDRYFSIQLINLYTHNFAYIGTRATGNGGGTYMIAGPGWSGEKPDSIDKVFGSETELVLAVYRTQLKGPEDMDVVQVIQGGYEAQPLSRFRSAAVAEAVPSVDWPTPTRAMSKSADFFRFLDFALRFAPVHESERELRKRFERIGVGADQPFDADSLTKETRTALEEGIQDAWKEYAALQERVDAGEVSSGDMFGTREYLKNNYLYRFGAARIGLYGNSKEEALYPIYSVDSDRQPLDASKHRYTLTLGEQDLTAAKAFWSVTMYDGKTQLLIDNPLNRYLINSAMLGSLTKSEGGSSVTLYIQKDSPGADKESNWLPAPDGPFYAVMRLYIPAPAVLDGTWKAPPMKRAQ